MGGFVSVWGVSLACAMENQADDSSEKLVFSPRNADRGDLWSTWVIGPRLLLSQT